MQNSISESSGAGGFGGGALLECRAGTDWPLGAWARIVESSKEAFFAVFVFPSNFLTSPFPSVFFHWVSLTARARWCYSML